MRWSVWFCVGLSLSVATWPAAAQWKWKDARGQVVISDTPPPRDIPERDVLQKPSMVVQRAAAQPTPAPSAPSAETVAKAKVDPELEARRKKSETEQADKQKAEDVKVAAQRAENCQRAKSHMSSLDSGIRLSRTNEKGEREILDDAQRAAEVKHLDTIIARDCKQERQ